MWRAVRRLALLVAVVAGALLGTTAPSWAVPVFVNDETRAYLSNPQTGMVVDVEAASTTDQARIQTWPFHGDLNQFWQVKKVPGTPYVMVAALHSRRCLDVRWGDWSNGTPVWQWGCHGGDAQLWQPEQVASDGAGGVTFRLRNKGSGRCLEIPGGMAAHGAKLGIWDCHGGRNQEWRYGSYLSNPARGHVADIPGWNPYPGTGTQMWTFHGGTNQQFSAVPAPGHPANARKLRVAHSRLCLGLQNADIGRNGAIVVQQICETDPAGDANQVWFEEWVASDKWGWAINRYRNAASGKCLDIWIHDAAVGARVFQWDCHNGWNQQWRAR